jgi:hypothetical protein
MNEEACQKEVEPFKQCCCGCENHLPTHEHCTTNPAMRQEAMKKAGGPACICGVQNGWACVPPMPEGEKRVVYTNWPEHSCGCELHTPRKKKD